MATVKEIGLGDSSSNNNEKISQFKKKKRKAFRKKRESSGSEDEVEQEVVSCVLEDAKELRKLRKRPNGVSALGLALGKKMSNEEELVADDPFKLKTGGIVDMKALKGRGKTGVEELDAVNLGNTFSAETNCRDEDADMMKYIEEELIKRKTALGMPLNKVAALSDTGSLNNSDDSMSSDGFLTNHPKKPEDVLFEVPEHLRRSSSKKSEEMLSNQMLSGIPEVDLGIEERIRNIEATEEAKQQLLKDRMTKKEKSMSFVPTNMAVNFVQHNRFNIDEGDNLRSRAKQREPAPVVKPVKKTIHLAESLGTKSGKHKNEDDEKATDDFHFEKFKKQFRRY